MSLPVWNQLYQQPPTLVATFTGEHAKRVHDSTAQLHQSLDSILSTLNRRAIALTKLANFESALHDAKLIQQLSPSSALGYICEASIYSEQGKQLHVIDVCSKGLDAVDTKDPDHTTLQQAKATAEQRDNTRIDFVSQLPIELVMETLVPMFMDHSISSLQPCPYLHVSTIWRDRIIQSPYGLRFTIETEEQDYRLQVVPFAKHTKALDIHSYSKGMWVSDLLRDNDFCSLQEMFIRAFRANDRAHFVSALKSIKTTMTDLTLYLKAGHELRVTDIVSSCPNLQSLKVIQAQDADFSSLATTTWPNMKNLSITVTAKSISYDHVVTISKRFPSLKKLTLSPCTDLQPALEVSQHFPSMKKVGCLIFEGAELAFSDDPWENQQQTITNLSLSACPCVWYEAYDLRCLLKKYQKTLVELEWSMQYNYNKPEDLEGIHYPRLKKLTLVSSGWWIPKCAPLLEELEFRVDTYNPADKMLNTIPPNLKKLNIMLYSLPIDDHPAVARYFRGLAEKTQLTHLNVSLGRRNHNFESIIDALCHLHHHLQHLTISFVINLQTTDMEGYLVNIAKRCSRLTCLEIASRNAPSINALNAINQLEHLEQLAFSIRGADQQEGFWKAVESFAKPKWIKMFLQDSVHDSEIKRLVQRRPDMKIMVHDYFVPF